MSDEQKPTSDGTSRILILGLVGFVVVLAFFFIISPIVRSSSDIPLGMHLKAITLCKGPVKEVKFVGVADPTYHSIDCLGGKKVQSRGEDLYMKKVPGFPPSE